MRDSGQALRQRCGSVREEMKIGLNEDSDCQTVFNNRTLDNLRNVNIKIPIYVWFNINS